MTKKTKIIYRTGNNSTGALLVEVLLSLAVFTFCIGFIFNASFRSISAINQSIDRIILLNLLENTIQDAKLEINTGKIKIPFQSKKIKKVDKKDYIALVNVNHTKEGRSLLSVVVRTYCLQNKKRAELSQQFLWFNGSAGKF